MFGVGIIGLGHVAVHHVAAIEQSRDFKLIAGCDPDSSRHAVLPKSTAAFTDADELLACDGVDVVVVASPNRMHVDHGIQAMQAGHWLFVEKPLARTAAEFDRLAREKAALDGNCTQALHAAFGVEVEWVLSNLSSDDIGVETLTGFSAEFSDAYIVDGQVVRHGPTAWGAWMDSGINALSVIGRVIDPEDLVVEDVSMDRDANEEGLPLEARVTFGFSGQSGSNAGTITTTWQRGADKKVTTLLFSDGSRELILDHSEQTAVLRRDGSDELLFACDNDLPRLTNHYIGAFADLASQMKSGADNFDYARTLHELVFEAEYRND